MARKRRREDILDRIISGISLRGTLLHPATLFLFAATFLLMISIFCWERYKVKLLPPGQYQLTSANLKISPRPTWPSPDLDEVILGDVRQTGYQPPSVMDSALVPEVARRLESIGWIEKIDQIKKSKAGLDVQLTYRHPVGMVEINEITIPDAEVQDLKPVNLHIDRHGVLLGDGLSERRGQHLLISISDPMYRDQLLPWAQWQDRRIQGAAKIGAALQGRWKPMGFYRLMTYRNRANATDRRVPFELWTDPSRRFRVHLIWGNPPGEELAGEASLSEKLMAMEKYVQAHGPFNKMSDRVVDVRSGSMVVLGDYHNAQNDSLQDLR